MREAMATSSQVARRDTCYRRQQPGVGRELYRPPLGFFWRCRGWFQSRFGRQSASVRVEGKSDGEGRFGLSWVNCYSPYRSLPLRGLRKGCFSASGWNRPVMVRSQVGPGCEFPGLQSSVGDVALCSGSGVDDASSRCWRNGFHRPVLKHGPRSLTYMRVFGCKTLMRNESKGVLVTLRWEPPDWDAGHHRPIVGLPKIWVRAYLLGPERWWTMPEQGEARGNSGGGSQRYWRANRSFDLGIGAKD